MNLLLEGIEFPNVCVSDEQMNFLGCAELEEVFFDLFEFKCDLFESIKESKIKWKDHPVVSLDIQLNEKLYKDVPFALIKGGTTSINIELLEPNLQIIPEKKKEETIRINKDKVLNEHILVSKPTNEPTVDIKKEVENYIKNEANLGFIQDLIQNKFHSLLDDTNDPKVTKYFNTFTEGFKKSMIEISEKIARREGLRAMESGGGTNAAQYANGGMMNGNLVISGNLSAGNLLGHRKSFIIGDGINAVYNIVHSFGSLDVITQVYDNTTNEVVYPHIQNLDQSTTKLTFPSVVPLNNYRVVILY